jgi:hypothetical protein
MANGQLISVEVQDELDALNATLALYLQVSSRTTEEVLRGKGIELGIRLREGFKDLASKGRHKGHFEGPFFDEAKKRGWRTKVRKYYAIRQPYISIEDHGRMAYAPYRGKRGKSRKALWRTGQRDEDKRSRRGLYIAQELYRRQVGIGLLAASFLMFRKRKNKDSPKGWDLVENNMSRKFGTLSRVTSGTDEEGNAFFRIENMTPGIVSVGERHGIFVKAFQEARANMVQRLIEKQTTALRKTLKRDNK